MNQALRAGGDAAGTGAAPLRVYYREAVPHRNRPVFAGARAVPETEASIPAASAAPGHHVCRRARGDAFILRFFPGIFRGPPAVNDCHFGFDRTHAATQKI